MSVNVKQNGDLTKVANNISIVQANWNDINNTDKNTCIKNQPETLNTMEEITANTNENALAGANAVKELSDSLEGVSNNLSVLGDCEILVYNITSTGNKTFTRNINDYRYILFMTKVGSDYIRGTTIVPITSVLNGEQFFTSDVVAPSSFYCGAKYIGNNTFNITEYQSTNNARTFHIYGIK